MIDLPKKLRITAGVINMGGRIAWGSDTALMEEAAELIEQQQHRIRELESIIDLVEGVMLSDGYSRKQINEMIPPRGKSHE